MKPLFYVPLFNGPPIPVLDGLTIDELLEDAQEGVVDRSVKVRREEWAKVVMRGLKND